MAISVLLRRVTLLAYLGRNTLPIYVAHTPMIITALTLFWFPFGCPSPNSPGADIWGTPLVALFAVVVTILIYRALRRTPLRWLYEPPPAVLDRIVPLKTG